MNPDGLVICSRVEHLFLGGTSDRHERDGANALCQAFDPTADGREGGFVTDEKPPIEVVRNHERASGPRSHGVSDLSRSAQWIAGPAGCSAMSMVSFLALASKCLGVKSRAFELASFARNI